MEVNLIKKKKWIQLFALLILCVVMFFVDRQFNTNELIYPENQPSVERTAPNYEITGQLRFF